MVTPITSVNLKGFEMIKLIPEKYIGAPSVFTITAITIGLWAIGVALGLAVIAVL